MIYIRSFLSTIKIQSSKQIVKSSYFNKKETKKNTELAQLKSQLAKKQPINNPQLLYKQYHHRQVYQRIDTNLESFFHKREYNIENFNFLINLLAEQKKSYQIESVLQKMNLLKVYPDVKTYNYIIKAYAEQGNIQKAQSYFELASKKFLPNKYLYTTLMQVYVIKNDPQKAYLILMQAMQKGIVPDVAIYTTLINSFRIGRKLQKCWEINRKLKATKQQLDETYVGVMLKVHAATHDAQKAIKLYKQQIKDKAIKPMLETINSYFKALSTRKQYSHLVIDSFLDMVEKGQIINNETVRWALKACSAIGSIRSASQILKFIKSKEMIIDKPIYNCLLRIYAKSCEIDNLNEQFRDIIIIDSWKLIEEIKNKKMLDTTILNNFLQVYANSLKQEQINGLVLPLYQKNNLPYNQYTFQILMHMYYKQSDIPKAMRIWHQLKQHINKNITNYKQQYGERNAIIEKNKEELRPTFKCIDLFLLIGIKMMDMRQVLDALQMFKDLKRMPKNSILKFLGTLQNLPQQIQASLMDFKIQFGKAKTTNKQKNIQDPQNL